jgi:hypothetical protein
MIIGQSECTRIGVLLLSVSDFTLSDPARIPAFGDRMGIRFDSNLVAGRLACDAPTALVIGASDLRRHSRSAAISHSSIGFA